MKYKLEPEESSITEIYGMEVFDGTIGMHNYRISICKVIFDPEFTYQTAVTAFILCKSGSWLRFFNYVRSQEIAENSISTSADYLVKLAEEN